MSETTTTTTTDLRPGFCRCGCGETTGRGATFRPGHDARLAGNLSRAHAAGTPVRVVTTDGERTHSAEAVAKAALSPALAAKALRPATNRRSASPSAADALAALS